MSAAELQSATELQLHSMPHPAQANRSVRIYRDAHTACRHLCDHVLTAPECYAWATVIPQYVQILDSSDANARWRYAEAAESTAGASAQPLYDLYAEAIRCDGRDAAALGWTAAAGPVTAALGTSGVVMLIEDLLTTAFLAGQGDPTAVREARAAEPGRSELRRERAMRSGRPGRALKQSAHEHERCQQRESARTHPERLYFDVFRPAVQFVRRTQHRCRDMFGRVVPSDWALLKEVLPSGSRLKYTDWLALRTRCREVHRS